MAWRKILLGGCLVLLAGCGAVPRVSGDGRTRPASQAVTPSIEGRRCLAQLAATGTPFTPLPDRQFGGGCSAINAVMLTAVRADNGQLSVTNLGPLDCVAADTFARWARFGVDRAAREILGSPLAAIETMGSYSCRQVAGTNRLSAHARAAAIDIGAFVLADGRRISVEEGWTGGDKAQREFLRVVHASACKRFSTVLGPDYNRAHRDHLHLELPPGAVPGSFCR